jgi:hypothetical protein
MDTLIQGTSKGRKIHIPNDSKRKPSSKNSLHIGKISKVCKHYVNNILNLDQIIKNYKLCSQLKIFLGKNHKNIYKIGKNI